jgi:hypothetical protein
VLGPIWKIFGFLSLHGIMIIGFSPKKIIIKSQKVLFWLISNHTSFSYQKNSSLDLFFLFIKNSVIMFLFFLKKINSLTLRVFRFFFQDPLIIKQLLGI